MDVVVAWLTDPMHWTGPTGIPTRLAVHIGISLVSLVIAGAIAFPVGIFIGHTGRGERLASNLALFGRALPSLAAIAIVVPFTVLIDPQRGFSVYPTVIAMVVLAIPPILVNTFTGIRELDRDLIEAARGMGLRDLQLIRQVELPLALPVIVGGVRSASIQVIATATLGALYGLSALGSFVVEGFAQNDDGKLIGGALLVTTLALAVDGTLALAQRRLTSPGARVAAAGS
jgi:osmoprotectant transport system permease protein